ncbi:hypothetical protein MBLNU230_g2587t1 [Neophaeotheca triangularis]
MATQVTDARFSTYSGAPSIQPSLAPTFSSTSTSNRTSTSTKPRSPTSHSRRYSSKSTYMSSNTPQYQPTLTSSHEKRSHNKTHQNNPYSHHHASAATDSNSTLGNSNDPKTADIRSWTAGFERMQDERLDKQRYVMSGDKSEEVSKIALGAKVERALGRRMVGQDASFSTKGREVEKRGDCEVEVK